MNLITIRDPSESPIKPKVSSPLIETVLQALIKLLPHHPSLFRPFAVQLRLLLAPLLAPTPSSLPERSSEQRSFESPSKTTIVLSQRLYALLPQCAPKNSLNEEWNKTTRSIIECIHRTVDHIFRPVVEERSSFIRVSSNVENTKTYGEMVHDDQVDDLGLRGWRGVHAGSERITGLFCLLEAHIASPTSLQLTLPLGSITSPIERVLAVVVSPQTGITTGARLNPEISREEREALWETLPRIHVAAIRVISALMSRMRVISISFAQGVLEQFLWIFEREKDQPDIRSSIYLVVSEILDLTGPSLSQSTTHSLLPLIRVACDDLLPHNDQSREAQKLTTNGVARVSKGKANDNADSYLNPSNQVKIESSTPPSVYKAASSLLPLTLSKLPTKHLQFSMRSIIDRTAVLSANQEAMLASVLNPQVEQRKNKNPSSIMPMLARAYPEASGVEAVLRPRMPLIQRRRIEDHDVESDLDDDIIMQDYRREPVASGGGVVSASKFAETSTIPDDGASDRHTNPAPWTVKYPSRLSQKDQVQEADSPKRGRDAEEISNAKSTAASETGNTDGPGNKRQRLDSPTPPFSGPESSLNQGGVPQERELDSTIASDPVAIALPEVTKGPAQDPGDDSDSGSEIPPIILDSDTDEGDEDEEGIDKE